MLEICSGCIPWLGKTTAHHASHISVLNAHYCGRSRANSIWYLSTSFLQWKKQCILRQGVLRPSASTAAAYLISVAQSSQHNIHFAPQCVRIFEHFLDQFPTWNTPHHQTSSDSCSLIPGSNTLVFQTFLLPITWVGESVSVMLRHIVFTIVVQVR